MIESPDDAAEKHGTLVHAGDCERQWAAARDGAEADDADRESRAVRQNY